MTDHSEPHTLPKIGLVGRFFCLWRGLALFVLTYGVLMLFMLLRLIEWPLFGMHRPWTPHLTQFVCRNALRIMGIKCKITGSPMKGVGALVANHVGWMDILTLNAFDRVYFISKADVASWPLIGILARATGTLFIVRKTEEAIKQQAMLERRLRANHRLLFFPEGTSTDSLHVLPFKASLFQAFFADDLIADMKVQPVSVIYHAPKGQDPRFYGWWANMSFGSHFLAVLSVPKQGVVEIIFHEPVAVSGFTDRKEIAAYCEETVRAGHDAALRRGA